MADAAYARPSSTVVLVRAATASPEIFMVRRHEQSSFGAAHAFPGGVVDAEDSEIYEFCQGLMDEVASARLGIEKDGLQYYSAAIRELFEESGVLLADYSAIDEDLTRIRHALNEGSLNWAQWVTENGLRLYCDQLHYFSHWVTPEELPKRYSTRFFLAVAPRDQLAEHCGGELTESCWVTAKEMLAAGRRGAAKLHYPTIKTLESVARHKDLESLVDWARSSYEWGVTSMAPAVIIRKGKPEIVMPGDKDYPGAKS
ncbi:MAG: NUDIX hydrolase [Gammaproteobacteria bacterium]|nr:NUDIX hydrolase [Gammaproteobacteria bacterium]